MLRSIQLAREIVKVRSIVEMFKSGAWQDFMDEVIIPGEQAAYEAFKKTPAEKVTEIIEAQLAGKVADMIQGWRGKYEHVLTTLLAEQQAIHDDPERDYEIDQQAIASEKKLDVRFLKLRRWWQAKAQTT